MLDKIEAAIEDIRNGKMVIVVDDEDRENEGDCIIAAEFATPEVINFMSKECRGLICVALTEERCKELDLHPMVTSNTSFYASAPTWLQELTPIYWAGKLATGGFGRFRFWAPGSPPAAQHFHYRCG